MPVTRDGHILGADFSRYQDEVDFDEVRWAGVKYGFWKATEGVSYVDPFFFKNAARAQSNDVWSGAYHYFLPQQDPIKQAEHFAETAEDCTRLIPALDFETLKGGVSPLIATQRAVDWIDRTERLWKVTPFFYSYPSFIAELANDPNVAKLLSGIAERCPLWVAHYFKDPNRKPWIPFPFKNWTVHQFDGDGGLTLPSGRDCDFNWFKGTHEEFMAKMTREYKDLVPDPPVASVAWLQRARI